MKPEPRALGCVVVFWALTLGTWWMTQNAPAVLWTAAVVVSVFFVSFFIYALVRAVQEL